MAIAFVSASTAPNNASATTNTLSFTTSSGSDRLLIAAIRNGAGTDTLTSVTYNGVAMTRIAAQKDTGGTDVYSYLYYLVAPTIGTHDLVSTFSGSEGTQISCAEYTGCSGTQPDAFNSLTESETGSRTVSVTVVASNCWLVATHASATAQPTSVVNGVERTQSGTIANTDIADSNGTVGTGAQTIGWGWETTDHHAIIGASIQPGAQTTTSTSTSTTSTSTSTSTTSTSSSTSTSTSSSTSITSTSSSTSTSTTSTSSSTSTTSTSTSSSSSTSTTSTSTSSSTSTTSTSTSSSTSTTSTSTSSSSSTSTSTTTTWSYTFTVDSDLASQQDQMNFTVDPTEDKSFKVDTGV